MDPKQCFFTIFAVQSLLGSATALKHLGRFAGFYWKPSPLTTDPVGVSFHQWHLSMCVLRLGKSRYLGFGT